MPADRAHDGETGADVTSASSASRRRDFVGPLVYQHIERAMPARQLLLPNATTLEHAAAPHLTRHSYLSPIAIHGHIMIRAVARKLPNSLKAVIRPLYTMLTRQPRTPPKSLDQPSTLALGSFGGFTIAYRRNTADEAVLKSSFDNDIFFSRVPEYQPRDTDVIIDVGAHIGTFSLLASSVAEHGKVFAIEASEDSFNFSLINFALNQRLNISAHHIALSDKNGVSTLYHSTGNWGHSTVKQRSHASSETIDSCTLSAFFEQNNISECHFMKMNCEGGEFPIILNTPHDVLKRFHALLILYHCDLWSDNTEDDLVAHLESSGFQCLIRNRSEHRGWLIATNTANIAARITPSA